jgi:hypothetical protein
MEIPRNAVISGTHGSADHTKEWYVAMGVGEMGCNVPSEVVGFDDGFQPEAIVWANPTRLDRAQNPPSTDTSAYKMFVKSPRRLLFLSQATRLSLAIRPRTRHICVPAAKEWWAAGGSGVQRHHLESSTTTTGSGPGPFDELDLIRWGERVRGAEPYRMARTWYKNRCDILSHFISSGITELPQPLHREVGDNPTQTGGTVTTTDSDRQLLAVALWTTTALAC